MARMLLCAAVVLLAAATAVEGFAFDLAAKKYRCFTEELPTGVEFSVQYVALPGYAQFVDVQLTDPYNTVLWQESAQDRSAFTMTVTQGGDHALCFYSRMVPGAKYQDGLKRVVNVEFKTGTETQDYAKLATSEHLKPLELNLRIMEDTVRALHTEYLYYKERESAMRDTQEHVNARTMWVTIIVMSLILGFSMWQVRHLKHYFRKKRMID